MKSQNRIEESDLVEEEVTTLFTGKTKSDKSKRFVMIVVPVTGNVTYEVIFQDDDDDWKTNRYQDCILAMNRYNEI